MIAQHSNVLPTSHRSIPCNSQVSRVTILPINWQWTLTKIHSNINLRFDSTPLRIFSVQFVNITVPSFRLVRTFSGSVLFLQFRLQFSLLYCILFRSTWSSLVLHVTCFLCAIMSCIAQRTRYSSTVTLGIMAFTVLSNLISIVSYFGETSTWSLFQTSPMKSWTWSREICLVIY